MKKIGLLSLCLAGLLFGACTIVATTSGEEEKKKSTDTEVTDKNDDEEVAFKSITNLYSTRCNNCITLKWVNPLSSKLDKIRVSYGNKSEEISAVPGEEMELRVDELINGETVEFIIEAFNTREEVIDVQYVSNYAGHCFTENFHESVLSQGDVVGKSMEYVTYAGVSGTSFSSFSIPEVVVIPDGVNVTVEMDDNCSYDSYIEDELIDNLSSDFKSCFEKSKSVVMKPYSMCVYELTGSQYDVLDYKNWPMSVSSIENPKTGITYLEAIKYCNEYTEKTMSVSDCVYYEDEDCTKIYKDSSNPVFYINEYCKGYRLPTKAEWEFAARGGNPNSEEWKYSYAGGNCESKYDGTEVMARDEKGLKTFLNTRDNNGNLIVKNNFLKLNNMTGSVSEFTLDWYYSYETDSENEVVTKPYYIVRACGGSRESVYAYELFNSYSKDISGKIYSDISVEEQMDIVKKSADKNTGFRMVRSLD